VTGYKRSGKRGRIQSLSPGKQAAAVALAPYTAKNEFTTCRRATTTSAHRGQDYAGRTVFMSGTENRGRS